MDNDTALDILLLAIDKLPDDFADGLKQLNGDDDINIYDFLNGVIDK